MAMTFNDYITECELFPYSKENFDLVKEASELNIAALYIENQEFIAENASLVAGCRAGYMTEAANEKDVEDAKVKSTEKKNKWVEKIKNLWRKMVNAIKKFWGMLVDKWKSLTAKIKDINKHLDLMEITPEGAREIEEIVNRAVRESGIPISEKQREGFKKLPKKILVVSSESVKNRLAAVLCNSTIDLDIAKSDYKKAFSEKQLEKLFDKVSDKSSLLGSSEGLKEIRDYITKTFHTNIEKGLKISKNTDDMSNFISHLEKLDAKFTEKSPENVPTAMRAAEVAVGGANNIFADAHVVTADSIKLYKTIHSYQTKVVAELQKGIKTKSFFDRDDKKED